MIWGRQMNESSETTHRGTLYLVSTPIGNLGDISQRAREILEQAGAVACEDTRRTGKLLEHLGLRARRLLVANEHTEVSIGSTVIALLDQGHDVALVSDAGTPAISDPGERLVKYVSEEGYRVSVAPGPSAAVAALVLSGLPTKRWAMEGFSYGAAWPPTAQPERRRYTTRLWIYGLRYTPCRGKEAITRRHFSTTGRS